MIRPLIYRENTFGKFRFRSRAKLQLRELDVLGLSTTGPWTCTVRGLSGAEAAATRIAGARKS